MYAVVRVGGKQVKVGENARVTVPRIDKKAGSKVTLDQVLLVGEGESVKVGNPVVKGASVEAVVVGELRAEKVIVFKKKRRKGYKVRRGHRQRYTDLEITKIIQ